MSLEQYCSDKRVLVQSSRASAYEAARALTNNHVGAVIVHERGHLVGIVTDRDLAVRVIAAELDPKETPLQDIMSPEPVTLSIHDTEEQAITLMRGRHVRRIPILDGARTAGIVTFDDLIMAGAVDPSTASEIVEAQLAEPAPAKPPGVPYPTRQSKPSLADPDRRSDRSEARAMQKLQEFKARVRHDLGMDDADRALAAFEIVASLLVRRLTPGEAKDMAAQLPTLLREKLLDLPAGPDLGITRASIEDELARRLDLDRPSAASLARQVAASLTTFISAPEVRHALQQLPRELKEIFPSLD
jgi:uncharacterized protein (DUF2267 family)/predicted transcriptional regulator